MEKYTSRKDVPEKYKWDLTPFFKNEEEFEEKFKQATKDVDSLKEFAGCTKDANKLYEFLSKDINTAALVENIYVYSYLINDQELGVSSSIERKNKAESLMNKYMINTSFFSPELLKLSEEEYNKLFIDNESLNEFKSGLDDIYRMKNHILPEDKQNIITELENAMNHFDDMSSTMLNSCHNYGKVNVDGEEVVLSPTNYRKIMKSSKREERKVIRKQFTDVLNQYGDLSANFLDSYVKANVAECKIKNYKSAWDSKLFNLKLTDKVFKSLVSATEENLDVLQKYYNLYKKVYKYDKLYQYDLVLDLVKDNKEYSIEEAQELIKKALIPLGEDYLKLFNKVFDNRYIDYCQYKGKCSGGYSFGTLDNDSRILLSFNGDLDSVSTIAHEGGHNVHHQLITLNNRLQDREKPSIICEVASLTNECLLSSYLSEHGSTKEERLAGIDNIMGVIVSNLFGAVREGKMEQDMYEHVEKDGTLTKDYMDKLTIDALSKYYGNSVELDENSNTSWMNRSHYYMFFYLYSYAICISVASNVAKEILAGNKEMLDNYIKFLSTGSNVDNLDTFKILGVDIESKDVYINAIKYFDELIDKFNEIYEEA
jgi:oligoendopeptidase F